MSSVILTGATTPLGELVLRRLLHAPELDHVVAVGREPVANIAPPHKARLHHLQLDLTHSRARRDLLFKTGVELEVDVLLHLATHRSIDDAGPQIHALNVDTLRDLLWLVQDHPTIRRFIFLSTAAVYRVGPHLPSLISEDHPLETLGAPRWTHDRVAADLTACSAIGRSPCSVMVLRAADCFAPNMGSLWFEYLQAKRPLRALGFDPMIDLLSPEDLALALDLARRSNAAGVLNIPGADHLPLSTLARLNGRPARAVPPRILSVLGRATNGRAWSAAKNVLLTRLLFGSVLDGRRAEAVLGYRPSSPLSFNRPAAEAVAQARQGTPRHHWRSSSAPAS